MSILNTFLFVVLSGNFSCSGQILPDLLKYKPTSDIYFNTEVQDDFRGLEDVSDPMLRKYLEQETQQADAVINSIKNRSELIALQKNYAEQNKERRYSFKILPDYTYFFLKATNQQNYSRLFKRDSLKGKDVLLFDPKQSKEFGDYLIRYYRPSWDGRYVAIALALKGEEHSIIKIYDVQEAKLLPQTISKTAPANLYGIHWLPDNNHFTYIELEDINPQKPDYLLNTKSKLYAIGSDPSEALTLVDVKTEDNIKIKKEDFPVVKFLDPYGEYGFLEIAGSAAFKTTYYDKIDHILSGSPQWKLLFTKEDKVKQVIVRDDSIWYRTALKHSNFSICVTTLSQPSFKGENVLVAHDMERVISDFDITTDGIYFVNKKNGIEAKLFFQDSHHKVQEIETPKESGQISISAYDKRGKKLIMAANGWLSPLESYSYDFETNTFTNLSFNKSLALKAFEKFKIIEIEVPSYDGIKVPVSIITPEHVKRDGSHPTFFFGYGSYGGTISPFYSPIYLNWVAEGGIFVIAHVRGGGEKGAQWHEDGMKTKKHNSWKDYIAVTEYMIKEKYTNPELTVAWGSSAGGVMAGRAITERPDLYKVGLFPSPFMNALRSEEQPNGLNSVKEFGTVKKEDEFKALLNMDVYHSLEKNVSYPAIFITAGFNDGRTVVWDPAKFHARLEAVNTSNNPTLLQVDFEAGHGAATSGVSKVHQLYADLFAFAFWQVGNPKFQLKN